jgi:hypothetical protein
MIFQLWDVGFVQTIKHINKENTMNTIRESIKEKLKSAPEYSAVALTYHEREYVLRNQSSILELMTEIRNDKQQAEQMKKSAHLLSEPLTFEEAAKPLMSYIAEHFDSDETIALVGPGGAELVTTVKSIFRD